MASKREDFKSPQRNRHFLMSNACLPSSIPLTLVVSNPYSVNHDQCKNIHGACLSTHICKFLKSEDKVKRLIKSGGRDKYM